MPTGQLLKGLQAFRVLLLTPSPLTRVLTPMLTWMMLCLQLISNPLLTPSWTRAMGYMLSAGCPGAGKSFLIRCMARRMTTSGRKVRLYATTGAAAVRLSANATTVHTGFSISARSRYMSAIDLTHDKFQLLAATDVFIIDEMRM